MVPSYSDRMPKGSLKENVSLTPCHIPAELVPMPPNVVDGSKVEIAHMWKKGLGMINRTYRAVDCNASTIPDGLCVGISLSYIAFGSNMLTDVWAGRTR